MVVSILHPQGTESLRAHLEDRRFAADLNLDQVFDALTAGRDQLDLATVLYAPLEDLDCVAYRHEVLADFERPPIAEAVKTFGRVMHQVRELVAAARKLHNRWQEERLFLEAVSAYCHCVESLSRALRELRPTSRGLRAFTEYLEAYSTSAEFASLAGEADEIAGALGRLRYGLHIRGARVTVSPYRGEPDYAEEVEAVFTKFREGAVKDYRASFRSPLDMDHVEGQVLNLVARLNPDVFGELDRYFRAHQGFIDPSVASFERGSQFYLSYLDHIEPLRRAGLPFCYPSLSMVPGRTLATSAFDLALATTMAKEGSVAEVVTNDIDLSPDERAVVVTGPNSGGKTTFARAFGQLHYLASLGLLVPALEAELVLADRVPTSFGQAEQLESARSHLEEELFHLRHVVEKATARSVVVMNESFSSTTLSDAAVLGKAVLAKLLSRGSLCLYVTFVDELASANAATISLVATVDPKDPVVRTYKLVRKPPEGLAYAAALAERYGLTYHAVQEQVGS
jgi:DNA mismatch repair protein MutS